MLLADPEIQLLMRADHVDERELLAMLNSISVQLRMDASRSEEIVDKTAPTSADRGPDDSASYRPGVGVLLLNDRNEVLVGRRIDMNEDAWQMPQGGIKNGEEPLQAALRELIEEIGTNNVDVLAESTGWLYYEVPEQLAKSAWGGRWRGQRQKWFVMLYKGHDSDINVATEHPEFNAWRWISLQELTTLAVSFKRQLYLSVLGKFSTVFRD